MQGEEQREKKANTSSSNEQQKQLYLRQVLFVAFVAALARVVGARVDVVLDVAPTFIQGVTPSQRRSARKQVGSHGGPRQTAVFGGGQSGRHGR